MDDLDDSGFAERASGHFKEPIRHAEVVEVVVAAGECLAGLRHDVEAYDAAIGGGCVFGSRSSNFLECFLQNELSEVTVRLVVWRWPHGGSPRGLIGVKGAVRGRSSSATAK